MLTPDDEVRILRESGALSHLDINERDVRDGHHRADEVLPAARLAYELGLQRAMATVWRHVVLPPEYKSPDLQLLEAAEEIGVRETFHQHVNRGESK